MTSQNQSTSFPAHFRVGGLHLPPFLTLTMKEGKPVIGGVLANMVNFLSVFLKFKYTIIPAPDNTWGVIYPNGTYTGIYGMIQRGEVDFSAQITVTKTLPDVDYTCCVTHQISMILSRKKHISATADVLNTFANMASAIAFIFVVLFILKILTAVAEIIVSSKQKLPLSQSRKSAGGQIKVAFTFPHHIAAHSSRMFLAYYLLILVFSGILIGSQISTDLSIKEVSALESLEQLVNMKNMKVVFFKDVFITRYFATATDEIYKKVWAKRDKEVILASFTEEEKPLLAEQVYKGTHCIIMYERFLKSQHAEKICSIYPDIELHFSKQKFVPVCQGISMQRRLSSKIKRKMDYAVHIMQQGGHFEKWMDVAFREAPCAASKELGRSQINTDVPPFPLSSLSTLFKMVALCWGISMLILLSECTWNCLTARFSSKQKIRKFH